MNPGKKKEFTLFFAKIEMTICAVPSWWHINIEKFLSFHEWVVPFDPLIFTFSLAVGSV